MTAEVRSRCQSCGELSVGDQIEAWHNGKLFHRGEVIRTVAATDLFWILDERTGTRRLIDAEALVIVRVAAPAATPARRVVPRRGGRARRSAAGSGLPGLPAVGGPEAVRRRRTFRCSRRPAWCPEPGRKAALASPDDRLRELDVQ